MYFILKVDDNPIKSLIDWRKMRVNECGRFKEGNDGSQIIWNNLNFQSQQRQTDHIFIIMFFPIQCFPNLHQNIWIYESEHTCNPPSPPPSLPHHHHHHQSRNHWSSIQIRSERRETNIETAVKLDEAASREWHFHHQHHTMYKVFFYCFALKLLSI